MSQLPGMPSSITCPSCGFENATTSLYCQDCGVRLVAPPSTLAGSPPEAAPETAAAPEKKKPRILSAHRHNPLPGLLLITLRTLLLAAAAALVILLLRPPEGVQPAEAPLPPEVVANIRNGLARSAGTGTPINVPWSGQGLNAFIAGVLAQSAPSVEAQLIPADGGFTLIIQHKLGALKIYTSSTYQLVSRGNGIGLSTTGATIGRVKLPGKLALVTNLLTDKVVAALAPDLEIVRNAANVQIDPQRVRVTFSSPSP